MRNLNPVEVQRTDAPALSLNPIRRLNPVEVQRTGARALGVNPARCLHPVEVRSHRLAEARSHAPHVHVGRQRPRAQRTPTGLARFAPPASVRTSS